MAGDEFAGLLRELKERSGLSYGVLGKRLHLSTSTLHRYVNGDAVPTDYAPVERFARVCGATPQELVELHRQWVRADVLRGRKGAPAGPVQDAGPGPADRPGATPEPVPGPGAAPAAEAAAGGNTDSAQGTGSSANTGSSEDTGPTTGDGATKGTDPVSAPEPGLAPGPEGPEARGRSAGAVPGRVRRRRAALVGAAVAAAVVSTVLLLDLMPGEGPAQDGKRSVDAAATSGAGAPGTTPSPGTHRTSPSASPSRSGSPTPSGSADASASASRSGAEAQGGSAGAADGATAPSVTANAYKWEGPCSQHYVVNREPAQVPPPPSEQDARGWVGALGGVAARDQMLALTVQGTGRKTVVLEALHVRVVQKGAPLAWNDYVMGVGCGGKVTTKSFDVNLDSSRPDTEPKDGQRDFPYKVSESDPEVFYVTAHAQAHDVSWYLELDWSSGSRHGTVRIDDNGKPFRTSGNAGRPSYDHPLGGSEWEKAPQG
ncbi:helix-turn-helix domain-containing protein [Streptomyces sp. NPDC002004]